MVSPLIERTNVLSVVMDLGTTSSAQHNAATKTEESGKVGGEK
jgi:hypothetical protein